MEELPLAKGIWFPFSCRWIWTAYGCAWITGKLARVYVSHEAIGTSNAYTNLLHATRASSTNMNGILSGQKWCTPISMSRFKVTQSIKTTTMALQHEGTRNTMSSKALLNSIFLADLIRIEHNQCWCIGNTATNENTDAASNAASVFIIFLFP